MSESFNKTSNSLPSFSYCFVSSKRSKSKHSDSSAAMKKQNVPVCRVYSYRRVSVDASDFQLLAKAEFCFSKTCYCFSTWNVILQNGVWFFENGVCFSKTEFCFPAGSFNFQQGDFVSRPSFCFPKAKRSLFSKK